MSNKKSKNQCKNPDIDSLSHVADIIKKSAKVDHGAPSEHFKKQLKSQILKERANKKNIFNPLNMLNTLFRSRFFKPAFAGALVIVILITSIFIWGSIKRGANPFSDFSKLIINSAYAEDNFELIATDEDSLGVAVNSKYILKSKEPFETSLIKDNLEISPTLEYDLTPISDKEWEIDILDNIKANSLLKFSLVSSYIDENGNQRERDYSWAYQVKDSFKVLYSIPRDQGTEVPLNTGIEISFSHDNFDNFGDYFSISPEVKGQFEKHGRTEVFVPTENLNEGTVYTVTVKAGVPLTNSDETLAEDYSFSFETIKEYSNSYESSFDIYNRFFEFSTSEKPLVNLYTSNTLENGLDVKIYRLSDLNEFISLLEEMDSLPTWSSSYNDYRFDTSQIPELLSFNATVNQESKGTKYIQFPDSLDAGFYVANISYGEKDAQIFIQSTDLLTYVNAFNNETIVWVNDLKTKTPASNAEIEFIDSDHKYETDNEGIAKFATPDDEANKYMKIQKDGDVLILKTQELSYFDSEQKTTSDYWKYFYTDRPMYQPDDTIKFWGMIKDRNDEKINEEITVSLYKSGYVDYYYQPVKIEEQEVTLDNFGSFTGEIQIKDLQPGYYTLGINIGDMSLASKYINVEEYIKPAYEITLNSDENYVFADETVNFTAKASFFEGTPVSDLELVYSTPDGQKVATTDDMGEIQFSYTKKYDDCTYNYSCWPKYENFYVSPQDSELAEISASKTIRFYGPNIYLQSEKKYPEKGKAQISMQTKFIDLDALNESSWWDYTLGDDPAPNMRIKGTVTKITYTKTETGTYYDFINKKTYKQYSYDKNEEIVDQFDVNTDENGNYVYELSILPETSYDVEVYYYDKEGKYDTDTFHLYYYNGSFTSEYDIYGDYNYYHFKLNNDARENKNYKLGENVEAYFMNNDKLLENKENSYLYMQTQNGLQEYEVSGSPIYDFEFEENDIPNVNLMGVYFNGNSYNTVGSGYYGGSAITYDTQEKALEINISSDKDRYEPGEDVKLTVDVTDMDGEPIAAEVNLNLVDEAFYALAEDYADPLDSIYNSVLSGSLFTKLSHSFINNFYGGAEKGGCFAAGTMILMSDGSKKPIEDIVEGDKIMTFSNPVDKNLVEGLVTEKYEHLVPGYLLINDTIKVTPEHLVFVDSHFAEAGTLKVGDMLLKSDGTKVKIDSIKMINKPTEVYNFRVDPQHTYFADDIYVHNEKGGGPREFFTDAALFEVIKTDMTGRGETTFTLPDNITSWRVTAQAISEDLHVGINTAKIPVSLPVFAEVTIGDEYLAADSPVVKLRAYGTALTQEDDVDFTVEADGMDTITSDSTAFESVYLPLPALELGQTFFTYSLETAKGNDAVKLPLDVIESRLQIKSAISQKLTTDTEIEFPNDKPVLIVLGDLGQNQLYGGLECLSWEYGDRVDQKLAKKLAKELLHEYYEEEIFETDIKETNYQLPNGGISLLPYSSEDLELSARIAALGAEGFDKLALTQYLFEKLESQDSIQEEITWALFGLAELNQPVLSRINVWLETRGEDMSVTEKLYIAQALADLGDKEKPLKIYYEIMDEYGENNGSYTILKISNDKDEVFKATALAAVLGASLNTPENINLWNTLEDGQILYGKYKNSENLFNLEKINFIRHALPQLKPSPSKVKYEISGKKNEVSLTGGQMHSFQLYPDQKDEFKFDSVTGDVGISIVYTTSIASDDIKRDNDVGIEREYYVAGVATNEFKEGDIIEVRLTPSFDLEDLNPAITEFQITDILPSGLAPSTKLLYRDYDYTKGCYFYPYSESGQKVNFSYSTYDLDSCHGYLKYFARVKTTGEYLAEPAIIQAYLDPEIINYSEEEKIKITE